MIIRALLLPQIYLYIHFKTSNRHLIISHTVILTGSQSPSLSLAYDGLIASKVR